MGSVSGGNSPQPDSESEGMGLQDPLGPFQLELPMSDTKRTSMSTSRSRDIPSPERRIRRNSCPPRVMPAGMRGCGDAGIGDAGMMGRPPGHLFHGLQHRRVRHSPRPDLAGHHAVASLASSRGVQHPIPSGCLTFRHGLSLSSRPWHSPCLPMAQESDRACRRDAGRAPPKEPEECSRVAVNCPSWRLVELREARTL